MTSVDFSNVKLIVNKEMKADKNKQTLWLLLTNRKNVLFSLGQKRGRKWEIFLIVT